MSINDQADRSQTTAEEGCKDAGPQAPADYRLHDDQPDNFQTSAVPVGDENYVEDRLGNTLAVVQGNDHVWIDVLVAGDDPSDNGNWHHMATLLPHQARDLIELLKAGVATLDQRHDK